MEDTIIKMIFNPRSAEPLECIQSLLILSLWHPASGGTGVGDGRLLITSAVTIAMTSRLNEASAKVMASRNSTGGLSTPSDREIINAINDAVLVRFATFEILQYSV